MNDRSVLSVLTRDVETCETFPQGAIIFREGDNGECMYAVHTGRVQLSTGGHVLEVVGPGGIFGEMILIGRSERSATATALAECQLAPIDQKRFDRIVQLNPPVAREIMWIMAERLTAMNERLRLSGESRHQLGGKTGNTSG